MKKEFTFRSMKIYLLISAFALPVYLSAQEGDMSIKLTLTQGDSTKDCNAVVTDNEGTPVKGTAVNFYIKRSVGLLPITVMESTDENGEASAVFPAGIPGDSLGNVTVIARLEDDEVVVAQQTIAWGRKIKHNNDADQRTLWGSRSNAPTYLIIASNAIILGIWGTVVYILFQLFFIIKKKGLDYNS